MDETEDGEEESNFSIRDCAEPGGAAAAEVEEEEQEEEEAVSG